MTLQNVWISTLLFQGGVIEGVGHVAFSGSLPQTAAAARAGAILQVFHHGLMAPGAVFPETLTQNWDQK